MAQMTGIRTQICAKGMAQIGNLRGKSKSGKESVANCGGFSQPSSAPQEKPLKRESFLMEQMTGIRTPICAKGMAQIGNLRKKTKAGKKALQIAAVFRNRRPRHKKSPSKEELFLWSR